MELAGFDEYPDMFGVEWNLGSINVTTASHKGSSEYDLTTAISDQGLSSPYAYNGIEGRISGSPCREASQSHLELTVVLPPASTLTDARQAVMPPSLEPEERNQASPESKRRPRISPAKWERIRPTFATLYQDQYKTLAETRRILEEEHSFIASEKLFKDKIKAWGLSKNLKKSSDTNGALDSGTPPESFDESSKELMDANAVSGMASLPRNDASNTAIEPWVDHQRGYVGNQTFSGRTEHSGYSFSLGSLTNTDKEILSRLDMAFAEIEELKLRMKAYHE